MNTVEDILRAFLAGKKMIEARSVSNLTLLPGIKCDDWIIYRSMHNDYAVIEDDDKKYLVKLN